MKRIIAVLLLLIIPVCSFSVGAVDEQTVTVDGVVYRIDGNEAAVIGYDSEAIKENVELESVINHNGTEYPVTKIADEAFFECGKLKSLKIPNGVTTIGWLSFFSCTSLTKIEIPDSVTSIDLNAFACTAYLNDENNWTDGLLYIGNHLISASYYLNNECSVKDGTITIAGGAFSDCTHCVEYVYIPDSVVSLGNQAFWANNSIKSVRLSENMTQIESLAFGDCGSLENIDIPAGVTKIGEYAFTNCSSLTSVKISGNVKQIDSKAFYGCTSLTSVVISEGVTSIGEEAFCLCNKLKAVSIPESVKSIGKYTFGYATVYKSDGQRVAEKNSDFKIYGCKGSEAEKYASENGFQFLLTDDINGDGKVNVLDLVHFKKLISERTAVDDYNVCLDISVDGLIDTADLAALRKNLLLR